MSDIQRQIDQLRIKAQQIESEQGRTLVSIGNNLSRESTLFIEFLTQKLRIVDNLAQQFSAELEELRHGGLMMCEKILDLEVQVRHEALKMAPELDHPEPAAIDPPLEPARQITDETGDQGMILEMGETIERRKRKAVG